MFDFGTFISDLGTKVANAKGYENLQDLALDKAAKNVARITDRPNETKQTPAAIQPGAYAMELMAEQSVFGLTNGQILMIAGAGVLVLALALKKGRK